MATASTSTIFCDGCGMPASPQHIAERLERLELATRYRPIHVGVLFIALAPQPGTENDFYRPGHAGNFSESLLSALDISSTAHNSAGKPGSSPGSDQSEVSKLGEFQRRGFYLCYVAECPVDLEAEGPPGNARRSDDLIASLAPALVKRIKFNYRPKHIVLLGRELHPLVGILQENGLGALLLPPNDGPDGGRALDFPTANDAGSLARFRSDVAPAQ